MDKCESQTNKISKHSFFNSYIMDISLFMEAILSMIATAAVVHMVCKHAKLKALVTDIAFQPIKEHAIFCSVNNSEICICKAQ